jgi:hypothetical protein
MTQKRVVYAGPLSTQMYCAIGMVAVAWAHLEEMIALCLSRLLGVDHIEFLTVSAQMQARTQIEAAKTLATAKFAERADALIQLLEQAQVMGRERNKIVHGTWVQGEQPNIGIRLTIRTHGRLTASAPTISAQEIAQLADQLTTLSGALAQALAQLGLYDHEDPMGRRRRQADTAPS